MLTYGTTLTSMTHGQGSFRMEMDHYDFVPLTISEKITSGAKRTTGEDAEE
jgi:elongation factor G